MKFTLLLAWLLVSMLCTNALAQAPVMFSSAMWDVQGQGVVVERVDGREAMRIDNGVALRQSTAFLDGTIDVDVTFTSRRSFIYLLFRVAGEGEHEEIYLRPHKSGLPDAVQYAPTFQGSSAWQFYHGPGATAAPAFRHGAVTHLRLIVKGSQAVLFIDDMDTPALVMPRLARAPAAGGIGLRTFRPPDVAADAPTARFSNFAIRPGHVPLDFASVAVPDDAEPGAITAWRVSDARTSGSDETALGAEAFAGDRSRVIETEPNGRLLLHRHLAVPAGARAVTTAARVTITAASAGMRRLDLGFSDVVTVFLNDQPLFGADAHYSFDRPRQEGLVGYWQSSVYLPLRAGENELRIVVADSFGGWGLMGRIRDRAGLTIAPAP